MLRAASVRRLHRAVAAASPSTLSSSSSSAAASSIPSSFRTFHHVTRSSCSRIRPSGNSSAHSITATSILAKQQKMMNQLNAILNLHLRRFTVGASSSSVAATTATAATPTTVGSTVPPATPVVAPIPPTATATPVTTAATVAASNPIVKPALPTTLPPLPPLPSPSAAHAAPSFLRPAGAAATTPLPVVPIVPISTPVVGVVGTVPVATAAGATLPPGTTPTAATAATPTPTAAAAASTAATAVIPPPVLPNFLRPAPTPLLTRLQQWQYFKHWPNIGYIISAIGTMVSDILWLRSIIILSNLFGIAVNYSFKPPFMIGIRWNFFFILANLIQIMRILNDRRDVELSEEEQLMYDALFSDTFSRQEYKKLLNEATWNNLPSGVQLMQQGEEITKIHLISSGLCKVEQDRLVLLQQEEVDARRAKGELPLEMRVVDGQLIAITNARTPLAVSSSAAANGGGASTSRVSDDSSVSNTPPSISRTIVTSLLQGGISWFDRFRSVSHTDEELEAANTKMGGRYETVPVEGSPFAVGMNVSIGGELKPKQHHPQHQPTAHTSHDAASPAAFASTHHESSSPSSSASPSLTVSTSALPDAVILPASPHGQVGLPHPHAAHAQEDAHHLLNVHVDSKDATAASTESKDPATASSSSSSSSTASSSSSHREVMPSATGLGDAFDMLHEEEREEDSLQAFVKRREKEAAAAASDASSSTTTAPHATYTVAPLSNEELLVRWREDRIARRAARLAELERARSEEQAEREKKRLLSRSALERQFGTAEEHANTANTTVDKPDAPPLTTPPPDLPIQVFERHTTVVGYIRASRLIGEMSMVVPGGADTADYSIAPVSVTTAEPTRVLTWEKSALQRLFFRLPSLAVGWYAVVSTDLVNRLKQQRAATHQTGYRALLLGVMCDGTVSENQKNVCQHYREEHDLSLVDHEQALKELGWTPEDWERGSTHARWFEWLRRKREK